MITTVMTRLVARLLLVPVLVVAVAVLVRSPSGVGDGFTAGLIAVLAVVIQYLAAGPEETESWLPVQHASAVARVGMLVMLAMALQSVVRGEPPLVHWPPPEQAAPGFGSLKLTTGLGFDAGVFLLVLGAGVATVHQVFLADREAQEEGG